MTSTPDSPVTVAAPLGSGRRAAEAAGTSRLALAAGGLLVAGPFLAAAAALRALRPDVFHWGASLLDIRGALALAAILTTAALDAMAALLLARAGWKWPARGLLMIALALGAIFLGLWVHQTTGLLERGLGWGEGFKPVPVATAGREPGPGPAARPAPSRESTAPGDPNATTVPPPAPAPAGLAAEGTERPVRAPAHAALFFGLLHLLGLLTVLLVVTAMAGSIRGFSTTGRGGDGTTSAATLAARLFPWQLAAVTWLLTVALLHVTGPADDLVLAAAVAFAIVLLAAPLALTPGRSLGLLTLGAGAVLLLSLAGFLSMDAAASRAAVERYRRPPLIEMMEEEELPVQPAASSAATAERTPIAEAGAITGETTNGTPVAASPTPLPR
ncbi:MAG TPA: hypothetical protein ENK19_09615 [Acidobacteria bacterium]|nr:hypothetical protein [Acidobacteriota bacterium]